MEQVENYFYYDLLSSYFLPLIILIVCTSTMDYICALIYIYLASNFSFQWILNFHRGRELLQRLNHLLQESLSHFHRRKLKYH
jgi:hypothetical protein